MSEYVSIIDAIDTWPKALVVVIAILGVVYLRRQAKDSKAASESAAAAADATAAVQKTLTTNNGGSTVKDAIDRIETRQAEQGETLILLSKALEAHLSEGVDVVEDPGEDA